MLKIEVNINSAVEQVLNFKTCCGLQAQDQNMEIMVSNNGQESVTLLPFFDLESETGLKRIGAVTPPDGLSLAPGEIKAMYCQLDETLFRAADRLILYDPAGRIYPVQCSDSKTQIQP